MERSCVTFCPATLSGEHCQLSVLQQAATPFPIPSRVQAHKAKLAVAAKASWARPHSRQNRIRGVRRYRQERSALAAIERVHRDLSAAAEPGGASDVRLSALISAAGQAGRNATLDELHSDYAIKLREFRRCGALFVALHSWACQLICSWCSCHVGDAGSTWLW